MRVMNQSGALMSWHSGTPAEADGVATGTEPFVEVKRMEAYGVEQNFCGSGSLEELLAFAWSNFCGGGERLNWELGHSRTFCFSTSLGFEFCMMELVATLCCARVHYSCSVTC